MGHRHSALQARIRTLVVCAAACHAFTPLLRASGVQDPASLRELNLEQLGDVVVTSVSKQSDDLWQTAAAVSVLTADDIRRSGATSIPELLRLVPGVEVARLDTSHYSIGVRGFGEPFSKSLLVLVDGRNLYNQLFAGTYWAAEDLPIDDVERIEVIKGPGGTIWGSNAINGVINVITKGAGATLGARASIGTGSSEPAVASVRYGGGTEEGLSYRVFARAFNRGPQFHADGADFDKDWWATSGGFRIDRPAVVGGRLSIEGELSRGRHGQRVRVATFSSPWTGFVDDPVDTAGGHLLASWQRPAGGGEVEFQTYYTRTAWAAPHFEETRDTIDLDYHQRATIGRRNQLSWGAGFRWSAGAFGQTVPTLDFSPRDETERLGRLFVRDEFELVPARLFVTAGSTFEHNIYTGLELQPTARLLWRARPAQSLWGGITRAVRTPSRIERSVRAMSFSRTVQNIPAFLEIAGNDGFDAERVVSYTAGYRARLAPNFHLDASVFHNEHDDLVGFTQLPFVIRTTPSVHVVVPVPYANLVFGQSQGFEVVPDWRAASNWRLFGSYAFRRIDLRARPENVDPNAVLRYEGSSPAHLAHVRSRLDLPGRVEVDAGYRFVSALPFGGVERYHSADVRLGWRPLPSLELAVAGQDLLQPRHVEFGSESAAVAVTRRASFTLTWTRQGGQ